MVIHTENPDTAASGIMRADSFLQKESQSWEREVGDKNNQEPRNIPTEGPRGLSLLALARRYMRG